MTLHVRRDDEIHAEEGGWFHARWHFSFARYRDPDHMGLGPLRVFNDDRLEPGAVWPLHPHKDVEGITYVVEGLFRHEDCLGNDGVLPEGAVQRMTLGSGAYHSEQNACDDEPMRFIQLWILPDTAGLPPECEQRVFTKANRTDRLLRLVAPQGGEAVQGAVKVHREEAVKVHQDAAVYVASLSDGAEVAHDIGDGRGLYVYVIDGEAVFDHEKVATGDAAYVTDQPRLTIRGGAPSQRTGAAELILVDVPLRYEPVGAWAR